MQIQQHSFNCPYQAGSPKLHPHSNNANDAEVYELDLQPHDVIVMATDGVLDNLWDEDLQDIISAFNQVHFHPLQPLGKPTSASSESGRAVSILVYVHRGYIFPSAFIAGLINGSTLVK